MPAGGRLTRGLGRASASTVRNREGGSRHRLGPQNDRRERRSGDSLCRAGKTGENRRKSGRRERLRDEGREGETRAEVSFEGLRVAEDPRRASRAGD